MGQEDSALKGRIIRGIAGFYYIETPDGRIYACKPRGILRRDEVKPLPGDEAAFVVTHEQDMEGSLVKIMPRRNALIRPPVANVDQALLFFAARDPEPSLTLIDRYLIVIKDIGLPALIAFNKSDIADGGEIKRLKDTYAGAGIEVLFVSVKTGDGTDELKERLKGRVTVLAGPSGAGKSSLINRLCPAADMEIGELSKKISRGKNTTRRSELFRVGDTRGEGETWLVDTPGFTALELPDIQERQLAAMYEEFSDRAGECRFLSCRHMEEPDCAVRLAAAYGRIPVSRYESYRQFMRELEENRTKRYR